MDLITSFGRFGLRKGKAAEPYSWLTRRRRDRQETGRWLKNERPHDAVQGRLALPLASSPPAGPAVGIAGDPGGSATLAQRLEDLHALAVIRTGPARDLFGGTHTAKAAPCRGIKRADTDTGRRKIDQRQPLA